MGVEAEEPGNKPLRAVPHQGMAENGNGPYVPGALEESQPVFWRALIFLCLINLLISIKRTSGTFICVHFKCKNKSYFLFKKMGTIGIVPYPI